MALFGTNGVRGKLDVLTPALAFGLASSFALWSNGKQIAVARDMRLTGPMLHSSVCAGIMSAGGDVLDLGLCSSPVAEFTLARHKAAGLIIITASHNPAEWNALKFVDKDGVAVSRERGEVIERMATGAQLPSVAWDKVGKIANHAEAAAAHASQALASVDAQRIRKRKLRIALDFGNGTSALSAGLFTSLGCETITLNGEIDGKFPGRPSEPSEANVQALCREVVRQSADFGVAWDGDSDRVVFVDEKGGWIVGDKGFALSAAEACRQSMGQKEKLVVTTVATSRVVEEACAASGAKTIYTKVGAPYLSEKMLELGSRAVSGGEEVGGIIWPRFSLAKDGIFAAAKLCEMACEKRLGEIVGELPVYYNAKAKPEVAGESQKNAGLAAAQNYAKGRGRLTLVDGVRVDFEDSWVIVRASGTENAMRIFAEAKTQKKAGSLMKEYREAVENALA
ncbi:Phosphoglucomutase/phosphomannomutase [uncultured archaeon]|nr:Phosphoglucomutase/phosphomannomutase [uncultured archaeon]